MASIHYQVTENRNLLIKVFKALAKHFSNKELVSIEVWSNVLFLKFRKGSPTFFSKLQAAKLAELSVTKVKNIPIAFNYNVSATSTSIMRDAITPPPEVEAILASVLQKQTQEGQNERIKTRSRPLSLYRTGRAVRGS